MIIRPKNPHILLVISIIVLMVGAFVFYVSKSPKKDNAICTAEVKLCLDGSYVGRSLPNCEFNKCPTPEEMEWNNYSSAKEGIIFKYPKNFDTSYINVIDWPPKVQITDGDFSCNTGGEETQRAGETVEEIINEKSYCVTRESEGVAGSIYTSYAYATKIQGKMAYLTFSLRFVQCANYDDPKKTKCESERATFDPGPTIDVIAKSFVFVSD